MAEFNELERTYLEKEIVQLKNWIVKEYHDFEMNRPTEPPDGPGYGGDEDILYQPISSGIQRLYYLILAYLEMKGLTGYALSFRNTYVDVLNTNSHLLTEEIIDRDWILSDLKIIHDFSKVLSPFKAFNESIRQDDEINRLQEVLKNTRYILANRGAKITNETSIYKEVK
jgi:hypothetical protein